MQSKRGVCVVWLQQTICHHVGAALAIQELFEGKGVQHCCYREGLTPSTGAG
jgi:hypothetical protein